MGLGVGGVWLGVPCKKMSTKKPAGDERDAEGGGGEGGGGGMEVEEL